MSNTVPTYLRRYSAPAAAAVAAFFVGAIAILWSWNTIAVDFFNVPAIGFRHALAAEITVAVLAAISGAVHRIAAGGRRTAVAS